MPKLVEVVLDEFGFRLPGDAEQATHRLPLVRWKAYEVRRKAWVKFEDEEIERAEKPVYVTPDQEPAVRAIAQPGAWIVVREVEVRAPAGHDSHSPATGSLTPAEADVQAAPPAPEPPAAPAEDRYAAGKRVLRQRCTARSGLNHSVARWVITEIPGRVDGLCQCGLRIPDVQCPHQQQEIKPGQQNPSCKLCGKPITADAGVINNMRPPGQGGGAVDLSVRTPVPVAMGSAAPRNAYRPAEND